MLTVLAHKLVDRLTQQSLDGRIGVERELV